MVFKFSTINNWSTWRAFGINLFSVAFNFYPHTPRSYATEKEIDGFVVYENPKTYSTGLTFDFILLGLGFYFILEHEWV